MNYSSIFGISYYKNFKPKKNNWAKLVTLCFSQRAAE